MTFRGVKCVGSEDGAGARCLENEGKYADALLKLRGVFHARMSSGDIHDAAGILDRVRTYGLDDAELEDLARRFQASVAEPEAATVGGLTTREADAVDHVRVLVVGGDETQAKIADRVKSKVTDRDPLAAVEFLHTGWTSNWSEYATEIKRRVATYDAVVVMRYIRTTLGHHVRAICRDQDRPWRFCWSGGQGGMVKAVLAAAGAGRDAKNGRRGSG